MYFIEKTPEFDKWLTIKAIRLQKLEKEIGGHSDLKRKMKPHHPINTIGARCHIQLKSDFEM